ncbi:MAG: DUF503 domain-containing protein [candidate division Zixibacteria bacterium]|nr:DUF503 domain-containing protein [candidate division Zixibacteria bacterium]
MIIGLLSLELYLPESNSLKSKRKIIKSIKDKIRHDFNVSIAEVGYNDLWQRSALGVVIVSNEQKFTNNVLNKIVDKLSINGAINLIDYSIEFL